MIKIEIKNISKSYGKTNAVNNVSLDIEEMEVFGLLGPNGAGKSTLISMLTTLINPDKGEIFINGYSIRKNSGEIKKILGIVPQDIALYPTLSARENLMFWGRMYNIRGSKLKERVDEALVIAGLTERAKDRIDSYSGGMKRRINIAAALLHHPQIVIMDEPTVGIDPQSRNHILETVLKLNKEGMTVVYTSHYMEEVEFLCSKIAIMDKGKIIAKGTKEELKKLLGEKQIINIKLQKVEKGLEEEFNVLNIISLNINDNILHIEVEDSEKVLGKIISLLESKKCNIQSVELEDQNLERVFLHLTGRALRD